MKIRKPAVAGSFYPDGKEELISMIRSMHLEHNFTVDTGSNKTIIGGIVPHAGYMYSGKIAMPFFQAIASAPCRYETIIILHPNHYGRGPDVALDINEAWETPLGCVSIDLELGKTLDISKSQEAHRFEHSGEVMLPFLQYFLPYDFRILPLALAHQDLSTSKQMAEKISHAIKSTGRNVLIIASSDFSHFVSQDHGKTLDDKAIDQIFALNAAGFHDTVKRYNISICGWGPILTLMEFALQTEKNVKVEMLARGHSGQVHFHEDVVHYATILFYEPEKQ